MAKSKPTLNLVSRSAASCPTAPSSSASSRPRSEHPSQQGSNLIAQSAGKPAAGGSNQNDAASSSQVWLTDAKMSERARKLAAAETNREQSFPERARKLAAENLDINDEDGSKLPHNLGKSRANVPHFSENLLELATTTQTQASRQRGGPRCAYVDMENVYDCHPTSRSSSWE